MEFEFGPYRLNRQLRDVAGPAGTLDLSARAFDVLCLLLGRPGELVGKDEIFAAVWPGVAVEENTLQVHISALRKALGPDLIVTVHGRGYKYAGPAPTEVAHANAATSEKLTRKPVIAVLPFDNLSGDPEQQFFSDGITQDIIDRLTRFRMLSVIGQESAFALRGTGPAEARDRLAADYVLTGNLRTAGGRIRIAARLADAHTGAAVWAEHYDRPIEDIFAVQDEVAAIIASTLMGRVEIETGTRNAARNPNLSSYELVLRGMWNFRKMTREGIAEATRCFERAISVWPDNAEAHRYLAICYMSLWWDDFRPEGPPRALATAMVAVELDPLSATCHQALGICRLWAEGTEQAARSYATALELNPGDPAVLIEVGVLNAYQGNPVIAREYLEKAFKLNPFPPAWYHEFRGIADFVEGRYAEALAAIEPITEPAFDNMYTLACLGHLGQAERARALRTRLAEAGRNWDFMAGAAREPYRDPRVRENLVRGFEMALSL